MVTLIIASLILAGITLFGLLLIGWLMVFINDILIDIFGPCSALPPFITGFIFLFLMFFFIGLSNGLGN